MQRSSVFSPEVNGKFRRVSMHQIWTPDEFAEFLPELRLDRAHDHSATVFAVIGCIFWRLRRE